MKIGVFDSGRGGEFIADGLRALLPDFEYVVVNDHAHVPYGSRSDSEVAALTDAALLPLFQAACPIIVIACNTATLAAITSLRKDHPNTKFIGIEPMIKPAAIISSTNHVTVLATPLTLKSKRYRQLIDEYAKNTIIDEPNAHGWAAAIEAGSPESIAFNELAASINSGSDTIVLACTHYLALIQRIEEVFPGINILEPTEAIARQITALTAPWAE